MFTTAIKRGVSIGFVVLASVSYCLGTTKPSMGIGEKLIYQGQIDEAYKVLNQEIKKGNVRALYLLGNLYISDLNAQKDYEKGIPLLRQAADRNYPPAITELAHLYLGGEGVQKDERQALTLYKKAADMGYGSAQFNCGIMYKNGRGTEKNLKLGYYYLCLASLNPEDLENVAQDAIPYRDEIAPLLSPQDRQEVLANVAKATAHKTI